MAKWQREELEHMSDWLNRVLRLPSNAVAVKLFEDIKQAEAITDKEGQLVSRATRLMPVCQLLGQSRYLDTVHLATADTIGQCALGAWALGLQAFPEWHPEGYVGRYFQSLDVSNKWCRGLPHFPDNKFKAILSAPLHLMPTDPDVVIFFGNTTQIYNFVMAYAYDNGERLLFTASGGAWCADVIPPPMLTGKPHIAFACRGARIMSWPSADEVSIGIPADELEHVFAGLQFQYKGGGLRYPIAWYHTAWSIGEPLSTRFAPPAERKAT